MRSSVCAAVAILIVVSAVGMWFLLDSDPSEEVVGEEYSIEYVLDGGAFLSDPVTSYTSGIGTELPEPSKDGYDFGGWHSDPGMMNPVVVVDGSVEEDLLLYACWTEPTAPGRGELWTVSGVYYNGTIRHTVDGRTITEYIVEKDGAIYYETKYDLTYSWDGGSTVNDRKVGRWTDMDVEVLKYLGTEDVGGLVCTKWVDEDGDLVWKHHMRTIRTESVMNGGGIVFALESVYAFDPVTNFTLKVEASYPVEVTGAGVHAIGDKVALVAEGDGFSGWYSNGKLVSTERTYIVERADPTVSMEARAEDYVVVDRTDSLSDYGFGSASAVTDSQGNSVVPDLGSLVPGLYTARAVDGSVTHYLRFFIDESRTVGFSWQFGGTTYSFSLDILYSDVYRYGYNHPYIGRNTVEDPEYLATYHTVEDRYIGRIVEILRGMCPSDDRSSYAAFVLSFVQNIPYMTDSQAFGQSEYYAYPLEYLWSGGGDCEDSSIFYSTLMIASGYEAALVLYSDHAMSAVVLDYGGVSVVKDGRRYVLCETTGPGFEIGDTGKGYGTSSILYWTPIGISGSDR